MPPKKLVVKVSVPEVVVEMPQPIGWTLMDGYDMHEFALNFIRSNLDQLVRFTFDLKDYDVPTSD